MANLKVDKYLLPDEIRMYDRDETASILGCHKDHVSMLSEIGCLSSIKIGKKIMFSYDAIQEFEKTYANMDLSNRVKALNAYRFIHQK